MSVVLKQVKITVNGYTTFVEVVGVRGQKADESRVKRAYYGSKDFRKSDTFKIISETDIKQIGL